MIKIYERNKKGLKMADIYYANDYKDFSQYDIVCFFQNKMKYGDIKPFKTILVDLTLSEDEIYNQFSKHLKRRLRKVDKEESLRYCIDFDPSEKLIHEYYEYFMEFASNKGIYECDLDRMIEFSKQGKLAIAWVEDESIETKLVFHTLIVDENRARHQYSASITFLYINDNNMKTLIGNANRKLIWENMKSFKEKGLKEFDMGGVTMDPNRPEMNGIDRFKLEFGGLLVEEFNYYYGVSVQGKLALKLKEIVKR